MRRNLYILELAIFSLAITALVAIFSNRQDASAQDAEEHTIWLPQIVAYGQRPFSYKIDESLLPSLPELPPIANGHNRPIGVAIDAQGRQLEFVANEVIVFAESEADLEPFLTRYSGEILRDGAPFVPIDTSELEKSQTESVSSGWYLIQVDASFSSLDDIANNMEQVGAGGEFSFSSEDSARLIALTVREDNAYINPLMYAEGQYDEHPSDVPGEYESADTWWWFTEDDDPATSEEEGLSVGVIHAWEYLSYLRIPPSGTWSPPQIAIIDGGFAVDIDTGFPMNNNTDYFPQRPWQADLVEYDNTAGGQNLMTCGGSPCPWHGTSVFGAALARHSNQFGGAGTAGNIAWPMLFRVDGSYYGVADAIRSAAFNGADVINLSLGSYCDSFFCQPLDGLDYVLEDAIDFAVGQRAVIVAAAGNDGISLDGRNFMPCEMDKIICVGSVNQVGENVNNYGINVDVWAPTGIRTTVTPVSAMIDNNNTGVDEIDLFNGTSASTPYVAGVIGMIKALDPLIAWSQVQQILQDTANESSDLPVYQGYIDAYRALLAVRPNDSPTVSITLPADNATLSYGPTSLTATASDPESDDPESGRVEWYSDVDGFLCSVDGFYYANVLGCGGNLNIGQHTITALAIDAHGATAQDEITVTVINHPPTVDITAPSDNSTFYNHQSITMSAYAFDQDGPWEVEWHSDIDGALGNTSTVVRQLSTGTHQITARVTDELGLFAEDSITLNIIPGEGVPTIVIVEPTEYYHFPDTPIDFRAIVTDPEDGSITGPGVRWYSNYDGFLGAGEEITASLSGPADPCSARRHHTITVIAVDSDDHEIQEQMTLSVGYQECRKSN